MSGGDDSSRRAAEEALCLLAVLESVLSHLGAVEQDVAQQLSSDLVNILNKQRYLQLIAACCQLLCTLAAMYQPAAEHVKILGNRVYSIASPLLTTGPQSSTPNNPVAQAAAHAPRYDSNTLWHRRVQLCNTGGRAWFTRPRHAPCFGQLSLCRSCAYHELLLGGYVALDSRAGQVRCQLQRDALTGPLHMSCRWFQECLLVCCRVLYLLGQLCRYGADVLDAAAAASPSNRNCTECLELCVRCVRACAA